MNLINTLDTIIENLGSILPEVCLALGILIILIVELIFQNKKEILKSIFHGIILLTTAYLIHDTSNLKTSFDGLFVTDRMSIFIKYIFLLVVGFALLFPKTKSDLKNKGEYHFLLLTLLLGAFLVVQSSNLLVFYLSLELISISSFILTTFDFKKKNFEAGIKYLLFGALSGGVMLYGISLLYGLSGSLDIGVIVQTVFSNPMILSMLSFIFFSAGLLFKISLVPMHIWTPDVYEAAPNSVVAVFSVVPKLAAIIFLYRVAGFVPMSNVTWISMLSVIAIISMFVGNLSAFWQNSPKRMMAYSSIAHSGFLLTGVIAYTKLGLKSLLFYTVIYAIMNVGIFYFIQIMEKNGLTHIEQYTGIGRKNIFLTIIVLLIMISLTGLPPTGGFIAKFLIFTAVWDFYNLNQSNAILWLFVLGLINTVIALFYYLKIPYYMVFKTVEKNQVINLSIQDKVLFVLITTLILILFFKADWIINLI